MTNIIRDVREDAEAGRIYLPRDEMARFGVVPTDLLAPRTSGRVRALLAFQGERAYSFYYKARPLTPLVAPVGRPVLETMVGIYRTLLDEIHRREYDVLTSRVALPPWRKVSIMLRSLPVRFAGRRADPAEVPRC